MVVIKLNSLKETSKKIKKTSIAIGSALVMTGLVSCGSGGQEYETSVELTPTQGIVTEIKEVQQELFRITDETVVETKDDSRIIAEYLDTTRDTFTLEEAKLYYAENPARGRAMNGILMGGLMGYMMGKSMSTPTSRNAYANDKAYNKSAKTNSSLRSTASRKTVKTPKKGFGSSKSSRSYGG